MSPLRGLDDFVLDKVAQPAFDRLGDRITCFDVALVMLCGIPVVGLAIAVMRPSGLVWLDAAAFLFLVGTIPILTRAFVDRFEREVRRGFGNPGRADGFFGGLRLLAVVFFPVDLALDLITVVAYGPTPRWALTVTYTFLLLWPVAESCTVPPPRPARQGEGDLAAAAVR